MKAALKSFPMVDGVYFGVNQSWMADIVKQSSGCGAAAGTNLALYYSGNFTPAKADAVELMESIYDKYIKQTLFKGSGTWTMDEFKTGMIKWFNDNGIKVKAYTLTDMAINEPFEEINFICRGLNGGNPVALLLWNNKEETPFHFVTITEVEQEGSDFNLTISTWGEKQSYSDFVKTWEQKGLLNNAFLTYFEEKS